MYTKHFGLTMLPFENVPDPKFFFDEGEHARIHNHIKDSLDAGRGLSIVTGPIGSGKTTLSQMLVADFSSEIKLIWIAEPPDNSMDLFMFIAQELGLDPALPERVFLIRDIKDALLKINSEGGKCLMIIDESHLMTDDVFNGIRLLNNLEIGSTKLIQILLLGQEEILQIINKPEMEPFKQRIATLENMGKMKSERIQQYISHRIKVAGGSTSIFAETGWEALITAFGSENIPRLINSLCDKSLTIAFEREKQAVDVDDVYSAAEGLGLQKEVFFYKIALKKKEKEKQASPEDHAKTKEAESTGPLHTHARSSNSPDAIPAANTSDLSQAAPPYTAGYSPASDTERVSLKVPLTFLFLSIAALVLSIMFYCQKSGSSGLADCLFELLNF